MEIPLRQAVEGILSNGETLSAFMEESIRMKLARRQAQQEFIARRLASREEARYSGDYVSSEEVLKSLDTLLTSASANASQ